MRALLPVAALVLAASALAAVASAEPRAVRPNAVLKCYPGNVRWAKLDEPEVTLKPLIKGAFNPIPLESVQFIDKGAAKAVMVQSLEATRTPTETVEIQARLVNCSKDVIRIEARTTFLTAGMASREPVSAWTKLFLQPHSTGLYDEKSLSPDAAHYLVEVRMSQ